MTQDEFYTKWDERAVCSQSACNPSGLLRSALEMISDWRKVSDDFRGRDCPHLKFLLYQTIFLVFGHEMKWDEWFDEYDKIQKRLDGHKT